MAQNITKRQHYVWRAYLKAWTFNDKIYSYNKHILKIVPSNLMNVAQKNYFNRFYKISGEEKKFLDSQSKNVKGPIGKVIDDIITITEIFTGVKEINEKLNIKDSDFEALEKNGFEVLHTEIEGFGLTLINCRNFEDIKLFDDDMLKYGTLMFICYQYFRTKKLRDSLIETFKDDNLDIDVIFSPMAIISAAKIGQSICFDSRIRYVFLEKSVESDVSFITGDQPVINLLGNETDEDGMSKDLLFYYPISPNHAIKITFIESDEKYQHQILNADEIHFLNNRIRDEYNEFLFSDSETLLEKYI
ncbi:DUF4238 domain-containing protein [Chryseobacterium sp. LC2016-27]|uniref:DUF4238 domain-containing protein n=1 Tax=Chryseobacterium sp. LC2016-27 TaxID=2897326 RepID=UPI001E3572F4|nr:DUF4238 domain-containing protein [Chryseobacterium sp. LC2016-27]MCD0456284.1 DUF4238 domain-containing protein [Chryseobacterium sp. LC2016-27]